MSKSIQMRAGENANGDVGQGVLVGGGTYTVSDALAAELVNRGKAVYSTAIPNTTPQAAVLTSAEVAAGAVGVIAADAAGNALKPDGTSFSAGTGISTLSSATDYTANLVTPLASKINLPPAWTGSAPALASGTNPITAGFGSNAFVYTGSGTSPALDGVSGVNGDIFIFGVGGVSTWTKWAQGGGYLGVFASAPPLQTAYPAAANPCCIALVAGYPFISNGTAWVSHGVGVTGGVAPNGDTVQITGNVTISVANNNVATYNGKALEFTGAYTVTLAAGLPNDFGFAGIVPATGNASIVGDGTTSKVNGSTTVPVTRSAASYTMFAVVQRSTDRNSYAVN